MPAYRPSQHPTWYCRRGNIVLGPVSTKVLHHYLFDGTLAEEDAGRVGLDGEWVPVVDLRRMFEEDGFVRPASTQKTRQAASEAIDRLAHTASRVAPARSSPGWLSRQVAFVTDLTDSFAGRMGDVFVGAATLLMKALRLRTVQVLLGCLVVASAVWGIVLPNWPLKAEDELATYQSMLQEMTALSGRIPETLNGTPSQRDCRSKLTKPAPASAPCPPPCVPTFRTSCGPSNCSRRPSTKLAAARLLKPASSRWSIGISNRPIASSSGSKPSPTETQ